MTPSRHLLRIVVVLAIALTSYLGQRQLFGMDRVFFQPSASGSKGLSLYIVGNYAAAARAYRAHWQARVADGVGTGDRGADLILSGDLDGAERLAREQLTVAPGAIAPMLLLAEVALERGMSADALRLAGQALTLDPGHIDALVTLSLAQARDNAPGAAIDTINRALRTGTIGGRLVTFYQLLETLGTLGARPPGDRPLCLLAHYHRYFRVFDLSQARPAVRYARAAIAAGDRVADAHLTLGILSEKAGRFDDALASFQAALQVNPRHPEALHSAAVAYGERGDLVSQYRMITAAFAESGDPYYSADLYHVLIDKVGDPRRAVELLEPVARQYPRDALLRQRVGHAWALVGDFRRALEHYQQAVALAPQDVGIENGMGWVLRRFGRFDEAIAHYRRAVALAPAWYVPHTQLMEMHMSAHRYPDAIAEGQTALRLGEPQPYVHALLCNLYHYEVDLDRAEACCLALLARDPGNVWARALLPKIQNEMALRR